MNRKKFLCAMVPGILVMTIATALATYAATPITNGIVGWWEYSELSGITANDSSGPYDNGITNNATLVGSSFFTTDTTRGSVLKVFGISGFVEYPYTTALQPATGTVSVWVKPASLTLSDIVVQPTNELIQCKLSGALAAYALRIDTRGRAYAVIANDNPKTCARNAQSQGYSSAGAVSVNQWTYLAMTWNGSTLTLYVNGKEVSSTSYTAEGTLGLSYHGTSPMVVAGTPLLTHNFEGNLSDLRIYSRALSSTEITNVYKGQ